MINYNRNTRNSSKVTVILSRRLYGITNFSSYDGRNVWTVREV